MLLHIFRVVQIFMFEIDVVVCFWRIFFLSILVSFILTLSFSIVQVENSLWWQVLLYAKPNCRHMNKEKSHMTFTFFFTFCRCHAVRHLSLANHDHMFLLFSCLSVAAFISSLSEAGFFFSFAPYVMAHFPYLFCFIIQFFIRFFLHYF